MAMTRLRAVVLASTAAASSVASAADMPAAVYKVPAAAIVSDWSGFYAGVNVGYGAGRSSVNDSNSFTGIAIPISVQGPTDMSVAGAIGGGQIGYNWHINANWLVGLEADLQWSGQRGTASMAVPPFSVSTTEELKLKWFGTVRGRAGVITSGTNLWYVTGGWAYGKTELTSSTFLTGVEVNGVGIFQSTKSGWALGGGLESQIAGNWTAKVEYLYMKLGTASGSYNQVLGGVPLAATSASANFQDHIMRAGVNYKFGGQGMSVAPRNASAHAQPAASWTGLYAGLNVGYGAGRSNVYDSTTLTGFTTPSSTVGPTDASIAGVIGGGQIGFNWQVAANWLFGLEADLQGSSQRGSTNIAMPLFGATATDELKLKWFGTVRGRAGVITSGTNLWYVTGGWAYGKTELTSSRAGFAFTDPANGTGTFQSTKSGWTLGGGLESQIAGNWTAKVEYLYMKLGTASGTYNQVFASGAAAYTVSANADFRDHIMRAGVNYRF